MIRPGRLWLVAVALTAGCATVLAPGRVAPPGDEPMGILDCQPPFAFDGETTIAALGLADITGGGPDATRVGRVAITRDPVPHEQFAPPGAPAAMPDGQILCVEWADGSGMAMMLPEPWQPPGVLDVAGDGSGSMPVAPLLIGLVVIVLAGVSWFAFRREGPPAP